VYPYGSKILFTGDTDSLKEVDTAPLRVLRRDLAFSLPAYRYGNTVTMSHGEICYYTFIVPLALESEV
jgi:hypothetical protein